MVYKKNILSRFLEKGADGEQFHIEGIEINSQFEESNYINKEAAQMKRILRKTANKSIPVSRQTKENNNSIWINSDIFKLIQQRQEA